MDRKINRFSKQRVLDRDYSSDINEEKQRYVEVLLKYLPSEVITFYLLAHNTLDYNYVIAHWIIFSICLILTPVYLYRFWEVNHPVQLLVSTFFFMIWAFSLGIPFSLLDFYTPQLASVILFSGMLLIPFITKKK